MWPESAPTTVVANTQIPASAATGIHPERTSRASAVMAGRYLAWMYPSAVSSSAVSTAPPAAPRTVLCERQTNR